MKKILNKIIVVSGFTFVIGSTVYGQYVINSDFKSNDGIHQSFYHNNGLCLNHNHVNAVTESYEQYGVFKNDDINKYLSSGDIDINESGDIDINEYSIDDYKGCFNHNVRDNKNYRGHGCHR